MRHLIFIVFMVLGNLVLSQTVTQIKIVVNDDLYILTDVTATPDSIPHGRHLIIYKNKTLVRGSVKDGLMDGIWTTFYGNGQQKMKGRYMKGVPHGEWFLWGENGDVQAKYQFNKGVKIGHWQGYYANHSKAIDIIYNSKGLPEQCIHYYGGDIISLNHEYTYQNTDTLIDQSYYYKNFNIFQYQQLKNGKRTGLLNRYHDNGLIWESYNYENDKLKTVNTGYSRGGVPKKNVTFRDGTGIVKKYYSNGNLYSKTSYNEGLKNDSISVYDLGEKLSGTGHFKDNRPVGKWEVYSKFHNITVQLEIEPNEKLTYIKQRLTPAPKEFKEGYLLNGLKHGEWKQYDSYGDLVWEAHYSYGFLNGNSSSFQTNKLMESFSYTNGNKNGDFIYYSTSGEINTKETFQSSNYLDTNWYKSPIKNWVAIHNNQKETHQKKIFFYPAFPGMEIIDIEHGPIAQKEAMFEVKRAIPYSYWPKVSPAKFGNGNYEEKEYIRKHLNRMNPKLDLRVKGSVLVRYKIDQIGLISEIVVLKSLGSGLDEIAIDMVKAFPPLTPAKINGIPVPSYVVREFDFSY